MARWRDSWAVRLLRFAPLSDLTRPGAVFDPDPERGSRSVLRFALANLRMLCPLVFHAVGFAALTQSKRESTHCLFRIRVSLTELGHRFQCMR